MTIINKILYDSAIVEQKIYAETFRLERDYWWHINRRKLVGQAIKNYVGVNPKIHILEAGCGTGIMISELQKISPHVYGVDNSPLALEFCHKRGLSGVSLGNLESRLTFKNNYFDIVTCLDVIEHLDQDRKALQEFWRILKPGGYLFLTVPAYQFLWTKHDDDLWHKRRYRRGPLNNLVASLGFKIKKSSYFYSFLIPAAVILFKLKLIFNRGKSKTTVIPPAPVNWLLSLACFAERRILNFSSLPTGISIFVIAKKV